MITVITAFVPIPGHPRPEQEYHKLGRQLLSLDVSMMHLKGEFEDCWLHHYLQHRKRSYTHSVADNPEKNSAEYHIVMAQKSEWLADAATVNPDADVLCWIDYGIFHVPGVTGRIIKEFLARAQDEKAIAIPGCWSKDYEYNDQYPCWRFCGGVIVMPREHVFAFDLAMKTEYINWIRTTGNLSWEVNTLARLERHCPTAPLWWYQADHNETMFTNYKAGTSHALQ